MQCTLGRFRGLANEFWFMISTSIIMIWSSITLMHSKSSFSEILGKTTGPAEELDAVVVRVALPARDAALFAGFFLFFGAIRVLVRGGWMVGGEKTTDEVAEHQQQVQA